MDDNKKNKLLDMGYTIRPCCGLCVNGEFPNNEWGTCKRFNYEHLKHTGDERQLSIHKYGACNDFIRKDSEVAKLGYYERFLPPKRE